MWEKCTWAVSSILALLTMCGCEIKGTVTDVETGEPIENAEIGIYVPIIPVIGAEVYSPQTNADGEGRYSFSHTALFPRLTAHADGYLNEDRVIENFLAVTQTQHFELRSMAAVKGVWTVTLTLSGGQVETTEFRFLEDGFHWPYLPDEPDVGGVLAGFTIDGRTIEVDSALVQYPTDRFDGNVEASLQLDDGGDQLAGDISFSNQFSSIYGCDPCSGTLVAVRDGA